ERPRHGAGVGDVAPYAGATLSRRDGRDTASLAESPANPGGAAAPGELARERRGGGDRGGLRLRPDAAAALPQGHAHLAHRVPRPVLAARARPDYLRSGTRRSMRSGPTVRTAR